MWLYDLRKPNLCDAPFREIVCAVFVVVEVEVAGVVEVVVVDLVEVELSVDELGTSEVAGVATTGVLAGAAAWAGLMTTKNTIKKTIKAMSNRIPTMIPMRSGLLVAHMSATFS